MLTDDARRSEGVVGWREIFVIADDPAIETTTSGVPVVGEAGNR